MNDEAAARPLHGIRVLELGQFLAGPFAATLLGYYGAEVIKVEQPQGGDQIRRWRTLKNGTSLWWSSLGRNKKCITLDLKSARGQELVKQLALKSDVLVENFRPGIMESWGLGPDTLKPLNPGLIYARVSGYGQTGPYASKPGYASACEGFGGFRYINGFPGQAPVRPNLSMGDTLAGLHAAFGVLLALQQRGKSGTGQVVDVALFESVFNLLESVVPEYDGAGQVREPSGSTITGIAPTNTYLCQDGKYVIIGGNGDSIFKRLMTCVGRADLAEDPRLAHNDGRVQHEQEVDAAINAWTSQHSAADVLAAMEQARVPAGPIYSVADMFNDPHYQARGLFEQVEVDGEPLKIPAILPKLSETPGGTDWPGPALGSHNTEIFGTLLGLSEAEQA
ncbi:MAG: CoA transferase, partial [Candidatus Competibacteraceae bacterium]|nr:CoA transferase [Candidatus Competibacteraceae bacterium]